MNSKFKVTIPKPCHENWNKMTPKEKGRFCSSCAKTVVDFTKKSTEEIQDYLVENKNKNVCGHFYKKQLDAITIEIPQVTFQQQLSFQKLFVLALFFVMGTTLFSCQYSNRKKQKIENVIVNDSLEIIDEEIGLIYPTKSNKDSITKPIVMGLPVLPITGDVITTEGEVIVDTSWCPLPEYRDIVCNFGFIEEKPRFQEAKTFSKAEAKKDFNNRITKFVQKNFDEKVTKNLDLREGKYKIFAQFTIDEKGNSTDIRIRAPHKTLEKEAQRLIEKLPQFIPGKQRGKPVKVKYTLPIAFVVE